MVNYSGITGFFYQISDAILVIDKLQSLYQGRLATLRESSINLPITFLDQHEELELFNPLSYTEISDHPTLPVYSISTFTWSCKLSMILDRILQNVYAEKSTSRNPDDLIHDARLLHAELEQWQISLPSYMDYKSSHAATLPHTLSLMYVSKLHRRKATC